MITESSKPKDNTAVALISVIVPVYKVEPYLDCCVQSIVEQTWPTLEIILVDDGSPDNCPVMCNAWAEKDARIRVIHKANGGLSDARNAGLEIASGDYISFIDSDDWISPGMLEQLYDAMQRDDSDIAACSVEMFWDDGTPSQMLTAPTNRILGREQAERALMNQRLLKNPVWYKLYRRGCVQGICFETGKLHEDVFWSYLVFSNARRVSIIDYVGYHYRQRSDSIMGAAYSLKRLDAIEAYEKRSLFMDEFFPALSREARVRTLSACIFHGQMAQSFLPRRERTEAFQYLSLVARRTHVTCKDYSSRKFLSRVWLTMARVSLRATCWIKTALGTGF